MLEIYSYHSTNFKQHFLRRLKPTNHILSLNNLQHELFCNRSSKIYTYSESILTTCLYELPKALINIMITRPRSTPMHDLVPSFWRKSKGQPEQSFLRIRNENVSTLFRWYIHFVISIVHIHYTTRNLAL